MKIILRAAAVFLLPLICSPLSEITGPAPTVTAFRSATTTFTASATSTASPTVTPTAIPTATQLPRFFTGFTEDLILEETARMEESTNPDWWVNSGAWFWQRGGVGSTWIGESPEGSRWRELYQRSNPRDTDQGAHPQNLFRLITRSLWLTPRQQVYFRVLADNPSPSGNRNQSNGVLLFLRYSDADNLYYAGIRVDGFAVIKKKTGGAYTTLAEAPLFPGTYDRIRQPNLIPRGEWIGLRAELTAVENAVTIQLYCDLDRSGFWAPALQANDALAPGTVLSQAGYAGIRTDFMDVEFDDYSIEELAEKGGD
jgi:hypothetical protein